MFLGMIHYSRKCTQSNPPRDINEDFYQKQMLLNVKFLSAEIHQAQVRLLQKFSLGPCELLDILFQQKRRTNSIQICTIRTDLGFIILVHTKGDVNMVGWRWMQL